MWDITAKGFFDALAADLQIYEIFLKPKEPSEPQKYQTRLIYEADPPDYPEELSIHVTLSQRGDPPRVKVAIHRSDTVQQLPKIKIDTPTGQNCSTISSGLWIHLGERAASKIETLPYRTITKGRPNPVGEGRFSPSRDLQEF